MIWFKLKIFYILKCENSDLIKEIQKLETDAVRDFQNLQ